MKYLVAILCLLASHLAQAETLLIPVLVGQTGASSNFGKGELEGYTMAVEEWNARGGVKGKQVKLGIEDTQTSQQQIVTAFHRLSLTNPAVIMGPTWLDGFQAVIPLAQQKNILLVTPSASREAFSAENAKWPVTFYHNSTQEAQALSEGLKAKGYKNVALIYEQEPFAEMIRILLLKNMNRLVADVGVLAGETSFQSLLSNLKAKKADALVLYLWDERSLLSLLQQIRIQLPELKLASIHDGEGWIRNPAFKMVLPQLLFTQFQIKDKGFVARYKERFHHDPILTTSNAYDAMDSVLKAYESGVTTGDEVKQFLTEQTLETATFGPLKFAADGSVSSNVVVVDYPSNN